MANKKAKEVKLEPLVVETVVNEVKVQRVLGGDIETNSYEELAERLILNHLIVIFNSFGIEPALNILKLKLDKRHWPVIKPFLIYLKYITDDQITGFPMDAEVVDRLRQI